MVRGTGATSARLIELVRLREQINALAQALLPNRSPVFGLVSLPTPNVTGPPELAFIRAASWLYAHYFEVGRVGVRFLVRRSGVPSRGHDDNHIDVVQALRTWSQHNIDPTSKHDARILVTCSGWFERGCGTRLPRTEEHWNCVLEALLTEAQTFLARLLDILGSIESDEDRDVILRQWEERLQRDWPAHRYHELVAAVAADFGRGALDPVTFYERHAQTIRTEAKLLSEDCDLEREIRKLIERAMLTETAAVLPITGQDIMEFFSVGPGPLVGNLLKCARRLYDQQPCDKDVLFKRMNEACQAVLAGHSS